MGEGRKYHQGVAALDAVYAQLPVIHCKGLCAVSCGPIPVTDLEARRLQVATHTKPRTFLQVFQDARSIQPMPRERCIYLTDAGRCRAYAVRPLICRVWGTVKMLSCMHGCTPDRWMTDREFLRTAQAVEKIGGGRCLLTAPDGLGVNPAGKFADVDVTAGRPDAAIDADAERTRSLRALHGGRIILAFGDLMRAATIIDVDKRDDPA
jgi:Fe-S-cluster containining protein